MSSAAHAHTHEYAPHPAVQQVARDPTFNARDPTGTKTLRARWSADQYHRFRALKGAILETVAENDALGIGTDATTPTTVRPTEVPRTAAANQGSVMGVGPDAIQPADPEAFNFPTRREKIEAFRRWLNEQVERGILELPPGGPRELSASTAWQNTYIRAAYKQALEDADAALRAQGVSVPQAEVETVFNLPHHADAAGLLYTRAFSELDGVTRAMDQEMSRVLAEGLTQGWNPHKTARELNKRVGGIGLKRARMIARTETIRAHAESSLTRYADFETRIGGVTAAVELSTAGDDRVCIECAALDGQVFALNEARGVIPVHISCRCSWVPVSPS